MIALAIMLLLAQAPDGTWREGGRNRGFRPGAAGSGASSTPEFSFATLSGVGMGSVCGNTQVTAVSGETLTNTRSTVATCSKTPNGGTRVMSGIADSDIVAVSINTPRIEYDFDNVLAPLIEADSTQRLTGPSALCSAPWADVGTPNCVADQANGPTGASVMDSLTDNDSGAFEGRSQAATTSTLNGYVASCYVKSSTATSASITMVGTGNSAGDCTGTVTGLVAGSSKRVWCASSTQYTAGLSAVTLTIRVGTVIADTGVLLVEGCMLESSSTSTLPLAPSSLILTTTTRSSDYPVQFALASSRNYSTHCVSATYDSARTSSTPLSVYTGSTQNNPGHAIIVGTGTWNCRSINSGDGATLSALGPAVVAPMTRSNSARCFNAGGVLQGVIDGTSVSAVGQRTVPSGAYIDLTGAATMVNGHVSRVYVDRRPGVCP